MGLASHRTSPLPPGEGGRAAAGEGRRGAEGMTKARSKSAHDKHPSPLEVLRRKHADVGRRRSSPLAGEDRRRRRQMRGTRSTGAFGISKTRPTGSGSRRPSCSSSPSSGPPGHLPPRGGKEVMMASQLPVRSARIQRHIRRPASSRRFGDSWRVSSKAAGNFEFLKSGCTSPRSYPNDAIVIFDILESEGRGKGRGDRNRAHDLPTCPHSGRAAGEASTPEVPSVPGASEGGFAVRAFENDEQSQIQRARATSQTIRRHGFTP